MLLALRSRSAIFLCRLRIFASCLATCSRILAAFARSFAALASFFAETWCSFTLAVYLLACLIDDIVSQVKTELRA